MQMTQNAMSSKGSGKPGLLGGVKDKMPKFKGAKSVAIEGEVKNSQGHYEEVIEEYYVYDETPENVEKTIYENSIRIFNIKK